MSCRIGFGPTVNARGWNVGLPWPCSEILFAGVWVAAHLISPLALGECQELTTMVSKFDPDYEFHQILNKTVGAYTFRKQYGNPNDPQYQREFQEFIQQGRHGVVAYLNFRPSRPPLIEPSV